MGLTTAGNRVGSRLLRDVAPIDTTVASGAINAGDMVYVTGNSPNGVASLNTPGTSNANAANFCGVSRDTYPIPYSDGLTETVTGPSCGFDVEGAFLFATHAADSFAPGTKVYFSAASTATTLQAVTVPASGDAVGYVAWDQTPAGGTLGGTITGAAGQNVVIVITPNFTV